MLTTPVTVLHSFNHGSIRRVTPCRPAYRHIVSFRSRPHKSGHAKALSCLAPADVDGGSGNYEGIEQNQIQKEINSHSRASPGDHFRFKLLSLLAMR